MRPYLEKPFTKIGLVEWLKVKALSSRLSTAKKTKQNKTNKTVLMRFQMGKNSIYLDQVLVAHTYNPSYSGGRDQQDHCLKPVQASSW
jgi:hypothetical protein